MAHHVYDTDSLILGGIGMGESNRFLTVWTRELGLVRAVGKSVRASHSKLKYHLQDYSYTHVSLVRGREVWRVTGAHLIHNLYSEYTGSREKQLLLMRVSVLLSRLLQGEESDKELFDLVISGMTFIQNTPLDTELLKDFEYVLVIRILAKLGYVGEHEDISALLSPAPFSREELTRVSSYRREALHAINNAIEVSGL